MHFNNRLPDSSHVENQSPTSPMLPTSPVDMDIDMDMNFTPTSPIPSTAATSNSSLTVSSAHPSLASSVTSTTTTTHIIDTVMTSNITDAFVDPFISIGERRAKENSAFREKLRQMALPLAPLVQLTSGDVHPRFPGSLLNFWLLTDADLESLASFYHQRMPCRWTAHYPCPVSWNSNLPLEEKRRKIGKFIGLRGCETPVHVKSEEELLEEARLARLEAEEDMWRRKLPWC